MKTIILFICFTLSIKAQSNNGQVKYTYIFNNFKNYSLLIFNKDKSIYKIQLAKSNSKIEIQKIDTEDDKINLNINLDNDAPNSHGLYTNLNKECIIENLFLAKNLKSQEYDTLFVKEKTNNIKWKLLLETKVINSFLCQKATCDFRGRSYVAWFTNEIPVSLGPWKLNGLPGLILEANDSKNQLQFYAEKITLNTNKSIDEKNFFNMNYITPKESREKLLSFLELINDEISQKIRSSLPRGVVSTTKKNSEKIIDDNSQMEINYDDIK